MQGKSAQNLKALAARATLMQASECSPSASLLSIERPRMQTPIEPGIFLPTLDLWLDSRRVKPEGFISHAHSDHLASHHMVIATAETIALASHRMKIKQALPQRYDEPLERDGYTLTLFPAGHCLGSAQVAIDVHATGERIVYTGDLHLGEDLFGQPAEPIPCDTLIIDATFGHPDYVFPSRAVVIEDICEWVEETFCFGEVPVVLAYSLGKGQEALHLLLEAGFTVQVQESTYALTEVYRQMGAKFPGTFGRWQGQREEGTVVLMPPHTRNRPETYALHPFRTLLLSGWAVDPSCKFRMRVDEALPLSDHCDWNQLNAYVEQVQPERVFTMFGPQHFAAHLRNEGVDAWPLEARQPALF